MFLSYTALLPDAPTIPLSSRITAPSASSSPSTISTLPSSTYWFTPSSCLLGLYPTLFAIINMEIYLTTDLHRQ